MHLTCVRHRVKDYAVWKKAFDNNASLLFAKFGCLSAHVVQVNGDPTDIVIINIRSHFFFCTGFFFFGINPSGTGRAA